MAIRHFWAIALAAGLLAACEDPHTPKSLGFDDEAPEAPDLVDRGVPPLTAKEIEIFLRDSTLMHEGEKRVWVVYISETGELRGLSTDKATQGIERAKGSWEIRPDGHICREWDTDWGGGTRGCAKVYRYGKNYLFVGEGSTVEEEREGESTLRLRFPGNPQNL
ncbi:MAG: hypothetical protein AAGE80_15180 [Pseudomonadota bacterium]